MKYIKLQSARITLRPLQDTDLEFMHDLHSLPETDKYNTLGIPENLEETKAILTSWVAEFDKEELTSYTFVIEANTTHEFIGLFGLKIGSPNYRRGEVWYKIHPKQWRKGYATEALNLVLDYSFETLNLHRIQAGCAVANIGSIKVLEKVGMIREGKGRQVLPLASGWSDNYEYAILKTDSRSL